MLEPKEANVASMMGEQLEPYGASEGGNIRRVSETESAEGEVFL